MPENELVVVRSPKHCGAWRAFLFWAIDVERFGLMQTAIDHFQSLLPSKIAHIYSENDPRFYLRLLWEDNYYNFWPSSACFNSLYFLYMNRPQATNDKIITSYQKNTKVSHNTHDTRNSRVFRHIKVTFKKKLLVEYTSKSSSYE